MDNKSERETRDFMNVESFSQLPFIRPAPPVKERGGAIRLFGKEFGGNTTTTTEDINNNNNNYSVDDSSETNKHDESTDEAIKDGDNNTEMICNSRKFECHYCCRNFPTSQALGGHQNAHKRERQHAKRAHLQSAMVHGDPHVYGLMNYNRYGSSNPTYHHQYSWKNSSSIISSSNYNSPINTANLYGGGYGSLYNNAQELIPQQQQQPINGSPLALWRIPPAAAHNSSSLITHQMHRQIPMFNNSREDHQLKPLSAIGISSTTSSQSRFGYESNSTSRQEHVSLDLHL